MKSDLQIFYTDDDRDDQEFFAHAVSSFSDSISVVIQNDGFELIDQLQSPSPAPDLIFLDLNMPRKSGYEVLSEIRQNDKTKNVPVIIFSTSDDEKAIGTTRNLGANLYIPKPASFTAIKKVIRHSLSIDWNIFRTNDENFVYKVS